MAKTRRSTPPNTDNAGPREGGGGTLVRSETVTVQLDRKLRYLANLAARRQRRTLSSFIEWAVEDALRRVPLYEGSGGASDQSRTVEQEARRLWDVDATDKLVRLAILYPDLLTYGEQQAWKALNDSRLLDPAKRLGANAVVDWDWAILEEVVIPALRARWASLVMAMKGPPVERQQWVEQVRSEVEHGTVYANQGRQTRRS